MLFTKFFKDFSLFNGMRLLYLPRGSMAGFICEERHMIVRYIRGGEIYNDFVTQADDCAQPGTIVPS